MDEEAYFQSQLDQQELMYELLEIASFYILMSNRVDDVEDIKDLHFITHADGRKFKVSIEEI